MRDFTGSVSILPTFGAAQAGESLTMSSREIAELLGSRHENVKVSIIRLVERGTIVRPTMQAGQFSDKLGRPRSEDVFLLDKRSSLIVVAQLSPEFTARIVDRWQELEAQVAVARPVLPDFTNPAIAARAWADEKCGALTQKTPPETGAFPHRNSALSSIETI